ncbi:MAG: beta-ketoacyl-ACP synthase III [Tagaea sp.]|nr:ketoacyl-ACP synthase III [Azospirillum sp.]MCA3268297.1 ketoacyl-ACP synthase III [Azospirillum sp.]MCZ8124730.1 ketoacyl-ACP synthase III [Magnetospirillum sp.]
MSAKSRISTRHSVVEGWGGYLPPNVVTNDQLAKRVDTSDEWIVARTGIRQRHIAGENERTSDLAVEAAKKALAQAGAKAEDVGLIVVATTTPDNTFPATATQVQAKLGNTTGFAFDVQAVCSGFVYALAVADNFIKTGQVDSALVIGAETFTRLLDWQDRTTCVLFGDGAGAVLLKAADGPPDRAARGVLSTHLHSDGRFKDALFVTGGPGSNKEVGVVRMNGQEVFRHAVQKLAEVVEEALSTHGLTGKDIDWLVPHQANQRIIDGMARKLGLPGERVVSTVAHHANTSAASIPLALAAAASDGRIKQGQLVLIEGIGGGLTWGASVIRW